MTPYKDERDWFNASYIEFITEFLRLIGFMETEPQTLEQLHKTIKDLHSAHGHEAARYADVPYHHGMAIYLLSHLPPFNVQVRQTEKGWTDPHRWVVDNYPQYREFLERAEVTVWVNATVGAIEVLTIQYLENGMAPIEAIRRARGEVEQSLNATLQ